MKGNYTRFFYDFGSASRIVQMKKTKGQTKEMGTSQNKVGHWHRP